MWNRFAGFILMLASIAQAAASQGSPQRECSNIQWRRIENRRMITEEMRACFETPKHFLVSENCALQACRAKKKPFLPIPDEKLSGRIGSPGFALCREWGGSPQLIEISLNGKWKSLSRCVFEEDQSFLDIDYLFDLNRFGRR